MHVLREIKIRSRNDHLPIPKSMYINDLIFFAALLDLSQYYGILQDKLRVLTYCLGNDIPVNDE